MSRQQPAPRNALRARTLERYQGSMDPLDHLNQELAKLEAAGLLRREEAPAPVATSLHLNDYLGLAGAASPGQPGAPAGAAASRVVAGTASRTAAFERAAADWLGVETCVLFTSTYAANVGLLQALGAVEATHFFSDSLNHASLVDGCRLSRAAVEIVGHLDLPRLEHALRTSPARHKVVLTEAYFSMDADSPDLRGLRALCDRYGAALVVDEAHSVGVFGQGGRGLCAAAAVRPDVLVFSLGKAFGLQGGVVAGPTSLRQWLWNRARPFVYSTAFSPLLAEIAQERLATILDAGDARASLRASETIVEDQLARFHVKLPPGRHGPIFPLLVGSASRALQLQANVAGRGYQVAAIRPPTVPADAARVRFTLSSATTPAQAVEIGRILGEEWKSVCGVTC